MITTRMEPPDTWAYGAGVLHGGWRLDSLAGAALEHTAHAHPPTVSARYVAAPRVGEGEVMVEVLCEGRSVSTSRTRLDVWDSQDRLVVLARQLASYREAS